MKSRCSYCLNYRFIVYTDYCPGVYISLCFSCCIDLYFQPNKDFTYCGDCKKIFEPKFSSQRVCGSCYYLNKKRNTIKVEDITCTH